METPKKRVFSGIQPTGAFTLGNYLGAVRNWPLLQDEYDCIYCVVDQHAITVRQTPAELRKKTYEAAAMLLASGIDPQKSLLFIQSHVPQHSQLAWVLSCNAQFGELSRMTQFKDKSAKHADNINTGLFTYPVLMAADILLYGTHYVPVGGDQKQHVELARDIAQRFNNAYSDTFVLPEPMIPKVGARIMSLQEPTKKMSKSDANEKSFVLMTDSADVIMKKFKSAVTDSDGVVRFDVENKPGISNLMGIYSVMTGKTMADIEKEFDGQGYGTFKTAVAESVITTLKPVQDEYNRILADKAYLEATLKDGAQKAQYVANKLVNKVYRKVGFAQF
ncbi:MAG: tryptophan--tRNA ligase [Oscillospiraceae bacterium]|nr:tryptophan--tRNA ligase [Oscillospiraceae bacterium]MBP1553463.1 tryptophan--tRNA ligase [Oscillospiraceae bacterium]MBQ5312961.1 tryptophan--tRNA ligase [Oscillospiraceae bacterium]MBQ5324040.1 tryptophan--tRNA ligase [Oscillospiraceae bacterium]